MLLLALSFHRKLRADLEKEGFQVNPCDACTANKMVAGSQCTVVWHVDDLKASHKNPKVVDSFIRWIEKKHGDDKLGKVKAKRGRVHDCLGMTLDFSEKWSFITKLNTDLQQGLVVLRCRSHLISSCGRQRSTTSPCCKSVVGHT